jgi:hypothetical protein
MTPYDLIYSHGTAQLFDKNLTATDKFIIFATLFAILKISLKHDADYV